MPRPETTSSGRLVDIGDTHLFVVARGRPESPSVLLAHGGPGLDHHEFADYLDPLTDRFRLLLIDLRGQGRSDRDVPDDSLALPQLADDLSRVAASLGLTRYAVLGHSYGAFVALQHACDAPGAAVATVASSGVPDESFLADLDQRLADFEDDGLREQITASWAAEKDVRTAQQMDALMRDQMPWHFADPYDPRIADYLDRTAETVYAPHVLQLTSGDGYALPSMTDRLGRISQPLLALGGRHDRTCPPEAAEAIAAGAPSGQLHIFEQSGHMTFVEQQQDYLDVVGDFLTRAFDAAAPDTDHTA